MSPTEHALWVFIQNKPSRESAHARALRNAFLAACCSDLEAQQSRRLHLDDRGTRPQLAPGEGFISLSHTREWLGLAYSAEGPVGLDLEERKRRLLHAENIRRRFLGEAPIEGGSEEETRVQLLRHWTRQEALLKAEGRSLYEELAEQGNVELQNLSQGWRVWDLATCADFPTALWGSLACRPTHRGQPRIIRVRPPELP